MKKLKITKTSDVVEEVLKDFKARQEARRNLDSMWLLNANYYAGNQYAVITPSGAVEDYGKQYYWQQREVFNRIAPLIETRLAKMGRIDMGLSVRPLNTDEAEIKKAAFSTKLIASYFDDNDLPAIVARACFFSEIMGTAFYKISWNPTRGKAIGVRDGRTIYDGEAEVTVCPPYEIYPDSLSTMELEDCQSIMHVKAYPVEEIERIWGVKVQGKDVSVMNTDSTVTGGGYGYPGVATRSFSDTKSNHALVIEKYVRPNEAYPLGRLIIVAGETLVYDGELPYKNGAMGQRSFPFVRQQALKHPASFFGISIVERLIPVQRAFNAVKNRKHEFLNRIAMGILTVEDGSVNIDNLEDEGLAPGKVIVYRQGATPPQMVTYGNLPNEFFEEEQTLEKEFSSVSGISDFMSSADLLKVNLSGTALNLLLEQDEARLSVSIDSIRSAIKSVMQQVLRLYSTMSNTERLLRVSGENMELEMIAFNSDDIATEDLIFNVDGGNITSLSTRQNMVFEIIKMGLLNSDSGAISHENKAKALEVLGFGNWEDAKSDEELHVERAIRENHTLLASPLPVLPIDDHALHVREHTRACISKEYDCNQDAIARICEHVALHKQAMSQASPTQQQELTAQKNQ